MTGADVRSLVDFLSARADLSNSADILDSLVDIFLSLNDMFAVTGVDDKTLLSSMDRIGKSLFAASCTGDIKGLKRMYRLAKENTGMAYGAADEKCSRFFNDIVGKHIAEHRPSTWCRYAEGYLEQDIAMMHCIIYEYADCHSIDPSCRKYMDFCVTVFRMWQDAFSDNSGWDNVPDGCAVEMLGLLQDYSCIFSDSGFTGFALMAYRHYMARLEPILASMHIAAEHASVLTAWHRLLGEPAIYPSVQDISSDIAALLSRSLDGLEKYSEVWFKAISCIVAHHCAEAVDFNAEEAVA